MILVNSGAFLSISSWFLLAHRTNFCHDTIHFFYWLPPKNARDYGSCASSEYYIYQLSKARRKLGDKVLALKNYIVVTGNLPRFHW